MCCAVLCVIDIESSKEGENKSFHKIVFLQQIWVKTARGASGVKRNVACNAGVASQQR